MEIRTLCGEDGPWATYAHGHVPLKDFTVAVMSDEDAKAFIKGDADLSDHTYNTGYVFDNVEHLYMRRITGAALNDYPQSLDTEWYDWCLESDEAAIPVTAFTYLP